MGQLRDILNIHIPKNQIFDMIEFFKANKIDYLYPTKKSYFFINIKNNIMKGGHEYTLNLNINKQKYQVNIEEYYDLIYNNSQNTSLIKNDEYKKINIKDINASKDKNKKIINFIKFNAIKNVKNDYNENDHCGVLIIDKEKNTSTIQSLTNYTDCVKCLLNDNLSFKIGDVLTQIMIIISIKNNLKKIYLTDNSYIQCENSKISLIHLRTMTQGFPYYAKYGFIPTDEYESEIYNDNLINYKKNIKLSKEQIIKYYNYRSFDIKKERDKNILNFINNILIPKLKSQNLVSYVIETLIKDKSKEACSLLYHIYMKIYEDIGYIKYEIKDFVLDLTKSRVHA